MFNKSYIFLLISFFLISCSGNDEINETASGFPVLSYSAEISETLNLDPGDIIINEQKEVPLDKLVFLKIISNVIKSGMDIVGVDTPSKM